MSFAFPKSRRLRRRADFLRVYKEGVRFSSPLFNAFALATQRVYGPRIGFALPKALGSAVRRNRMKRRAREALRLELERIPPQWDVVVHPKQALLDAPWDRLRLQVRRLVDQCAQS